MHAHDAAARIATILHGMKRVELSHAGDGPYAIISIMADGTRFPAVIGLETAEDAALYCAYLRGYPRRKATSHPRSPLSMLGLEPEAPPQPEFDRFEIVAMIPLAALDRAYTLPERAPPGSPT